jgi:hypothetical protein
MKIEQVRYARGIGRDIRYLLTQVDVDHSLGPPDLHEIQALKTAWYQNYEEGNFAGENFQWRETGCANCPRS